MGLLLPVFALVLLLLVVADLPAAYADFSKIKAELKDGQLRVEGEGPQIANAKISITGLEIDDAVVATPISVTADERGRFRIQVEGVTTPTCGPGDIQVTVKHVGGGNPAHTQLVDLVPCEPMSGGAAEPEPLQVVPTNICTESLSCIALEIGLVAGPLAPLVVPTPLDGQPKSNTIPVLVGLEPPLPTGTIAEFGIEGVLGSVVTSTELKVGTPPLFVYPSADTRFDKDPQEGDLVRVIGLRTLAPGAIVAERIRSRGPGPSPAGAAACEISLLISGVVTEAGGDVLTITTDFAEFSDLVIVGGLTEMDAGIGELSVVQVSFVVAANPVACPGGGLDNLPLGIRQSP